MKESKPLILLIENGVLFSLGNFLANKNDFRIALTILNQDKWYRKLNIPAIQLKKWIKEMIVKFQVVESSEILEQFKRNTEEIRRRVDASYYVDYTRLLQALTDIDPENVHPGYLEYHEEIFSFLEIQDSTPMIGLGYEDFFDYIEALIIYAAADNSDFNLHKNESLLITNEIKSYILNKPLPDVQASDLFFAILNVAKKKSKNHITTRFEGVVKSNLKQMNDEQDAYFLNKLQELKDSDGKHSTQEKLFDSIIKVSQAKVAPYEAKEKEAQVQLKELAGMKNPYPASYLAECTEFDAVLPEDPAEAIPFLWESIEHIIIGLFDQYILSKIDKKNLYFLFTMQELSVDQFEYLNKVRLFVASVNFMNWNQVSGEKVIENMMIIYAYYRHKKEKGA